MFTSKKFHTRLLFKLNKKSNIEPEAVKKNYEETVQVIITKILLDYKKELDIIKSSLNFKDLIKENAYFIELELLTPVKINLNKLNELRIKIKDFMVRDNSIKYISLIDESEGDEYKYVKEKRKADEYIH